MKASASEGRVLFDGTANLTEMKERGGKGLQDRSAYNKRCYQKGGRGERLTYVAFTTSLVCAASNIWMNGYKSW